MMLLWGWGCVCISHRHNYYDMPMVVAQFSGCQHTKDVMMVALVTALTKTSFL